MAIKIAFAEDDKGMRHTLELVLKSDKELELVGSAADGEEILNIIERTHPDIVLLDINMPRKNGLESTREIKKRFPSTSVVILTIMDDASTLFDAINAGANGYFVKTIEPSQIIRSIKYVFDGGIILPTEFIQKISSTFPEILSASYNRDILSSLSSRELEVLRLVVSGLNNQEIAKQLFISVGTVKNYISILIKKLGVRDRVQLVLQAIKAGIRY